MSNECQPSPLKALPDSDFILRSIGQTLEKRSGGEDFLQTNKQKEALSKANFPASSIGVVSLNDYQKQSSHGRPVEVNIGSGGAN